MRKVRKTSVSDINIVTDMAILLWQSNEKDKLREDLLNIINSNESVVFLAFEDDKAVGFAECSIRNDYVEGTETSPVGYLEGIYVLAEYRNRGYAKALLAYAEEWSIEHGCTEFASDCELTNNDSLRFHLSVGFTEANRIICFVKKLK